MNVVKAAFSSLQRTFGQDQGDLHMHGHLVSQATTNRQYSINREEEACLVSQCPLGLESFG